MQRQLSSSELQELAQIQYRRKEFKQALDTLNKVSELALQSVFGLTS